MTVRICEVAQIVRSKTAGPFQLTLDVIFPDLDTFERVRDSGALSRSRIASAYGISPEQVLSLHFFAPARAFKATLVRPVPSGSVGDTDIYGAQQHAPLLALAIGDDGRSGTTPSTSVRNTNHRNAP